MYFYLFQFCLTSMCDLTNVKQLRVFFFSFLLCGALMLKLFFQKGVWIGFQY